MSRIAERLGALTSWTREVRDELRLLPDTLRTAREGAANFELVSQRLSSATRALEDISATYERTFAESARRTNAALDTMREQLDSLAATVGSGKVPPVVTEIRRNLDALGRINPFWPGGGSSRGG